MREIIRNNSKFIIVMLIVIILGIVGVTVAIKIGNFNPIGLNVGTATIEANITYDSTVNEGVVTSIGKLYPIADSKVTGIDVSNDNVIKVKFMVTGKSTNPANTIYDVALRNIKMESELKTTDVKWRLYKNGILLSSGNFSPNFDTMSNSRMVLTDTQQDLTTSTDTYVFLFWISESCTGDIKTCTSSNNQNRYINKSFSAKIKIEASTKSKKSLTRTVAAVGDVNTDGTIDSNDLTLLSGHIATHTPLTEQQTINADINNDGAVDINDKNILESYLNGTKVCNFPYEFCY